MDVDLDVTGANAILAALKNLPESLAKKAIRPGLRKGAAIIRKQAQDNLRQVVSEEATGFLEKNVVVRAVKAKNKDDVRVAVTIRPGEVLNPKSNARVGLYGSVLETGKEDQEPRPWLRPAHRQKAQEAINALVQIGQQKLEEVVKEAQST